MAGAVVDPELNLLIYVWHWREDWPGAVRYRGSIRLKVAVHTKAPRPLEDV